MKRGMDFLRLLTFIENCKQKTCNYLIALLFFCTLALFVSMPALAGINEWTTNGPYGGYIRVLAIDPTYTSTVYAGTNQGVYKSTNGGNSWSAMNTGIPSGKGYIYAFAIDPSKPSTIYAGINYPYGAGGGVYKSIDGGGSWTAMNAGFPADKPNVYLLAIDPITGSTLYAGTTQGVFEYTIGSKFEELQLSYPAKNIPSQIKPLDVTDVIKTSIVAYDTKEYIIDASYSGAVDSNNQPLQIEKIEFGRQQFPTDLPYFLILSSGLAKDGVFQLFENSDATKLVSSDLNGRYEPKGSPDGYDVYDMARLFITLRIPKGATALTFQYKFATEENPTFRKSPYQDFFTATALINSGGSVKPIENFALLSDNRPDRPLTVNVDNAALFSNTVKGTSESPVKGGLLIQWPYPIIDDHSVSDLPSHVPYNAVTFADISYQLGNLLRLPYTESFKEDIITAYLDLTPYNSGSDTITLMLTIGDATDAELDSAVFIDNLRMHVEKEIRCLSDFSPYLPCIVSLASTIPHLSPLKLISIGNGVCEATKNAKENDHDGVLYNTVKLTASVAEPYVKSGMPGIGTLVSCAEALLEVERLLCKNQIELPFLNCVLNKFKKGDPSLTIFVGSPVDIAVYDSMGNYIMRDNDGNILSTIPDGWLFQLGDEKKLILINDPKGEYSINIKGNEHAVSGDTFNLGILQSNITGQQNIVTYEMVPTQQDAIASLSISEYTKNYSLATDLDGDGTFDSLVLPTTLEVGIQNYRISGSSYNFPETTTYRATFSMDVSTGTTPYGWLKYYYSRTRMNFVSTGITSVVVSGNTATITGTGTVNGVGGYTFTATVTDRSPDSFGIVIRKPDGNTHYSAPAKNISGGDLMISML